MPSPARRLGSPKGRRLDLPGRSAEGRPWLRWQVDRRSDDAQSRRAKAGQSLDFERFRSSLPPDNLMPPEYRPETAAPAFVHFDDLPPPRFRLRLLPLPLSVVFLPGPESASFVSPGPSMLLIAGYLRAQKGKPARLPGPEIAPACAVSHNTHNPHHRHKTLHAKGIYLYSTLTLTSQRR